MYLYEYIYVGEPPKEYNTLKLTLDGTVYENIPVKMSSGIGEYDLPFVGNLGIAGLGDDTGEEYLIVFEDGYTIICLPTEGEHTIALEMSLPAVETIHKLNNKYLDITYPYEVEYDDTIFKGDVKTANNVSLSKLNEDVKNIPVKGRYESVALNGVPIENASGNKSVVMGDNTVASGENSHAEGYSTTASGLHSHAEGSRTMARGSSSHAEGANSIAAGNYSHAEGGQWFSMVNVDAILLEPTKIVFRNDELSNFRLFHTEGFMNSIFRKGVTIGAYTYNGGFLYEKPYTIVDATTNSGGDVELTIDNPMPGSGSAFVTFYTGAYEHSSHAEGHSTFANGSYSHAEGEQTVASGERSHAEGEKTTAQGFSSHAEGVGTIASGIYSHVQGQYNIEDKESKYAHIVGNGSISKPSNAHTLDWYGNAWYSGTVEAVNGLIIKSSTPGSSKRFKITVNDSGTISTTEITE